MTLSFYLFPFLVSFFASVFFTAAVIWTSKKIQSRRRAESASLRTNEKKISRLGGAVIIFSFLLAIFLDDRLVISPSFWGIIIASVFILLVGIWDDFRDLDWKYQLFFQLAIATFIFIIGIRVEFITNPFGGLILLNTGKYSLPSLIFVVAWLLLMINSINWVDGIDGLSGSVSLLGSLAIFFLSLKPEVNQPPVGIIAMALAGSILGFLVFNFYPARIFAGTAGSWFMGFMLSSLAIFAGAKIATALLVLSVPVIDALWVLGERIRSGKSLFQGDRRHLHYKLLEIGWTQKKITLFFSFITLFIAIIALNTRALGKFLTISMVVLIMTATLVFINKKLAKNSANKD